eukprot:4036188-Alexandrium_andersonii.AAC.1
MEGCCLGGGGLRHDEPGELPFAPKRDRYLPPASGLEGSDDFSITPGDGDGSSQPPRDRWALSVGVAFELRWDKESMAGAAPAAPREAQRGRLGLGEREDPDEVDAASFRLVLHLFPRDPDTGSGLGLFGTDP